MTRFYVLTSALLLTCARPASAQEWLTSFEPHPRCVAVVTHSPATDLAPGTTRLVLIGSRMSDGTRLAGTLFQVSPLGVSDSSSHLRLLADLDSASRAEHNGLAPGRYVVISRALGYHPRIDTVGLIPDEVTKVVAFLKEKYSGIRCQPPNYRKPGQPACAQGQESTTTDLWRAALRYAIPRQDSAAGLAPFRPSEIRAITDEAVCRHAGRAYGGPDDPPRKVIVLRLGNAGFLVYDPFEPITAGEFSFVVFFDARWKRLFRLSR